MAGERWQQNWDKHLPAVSGDQQTLSLDANKQPLLKLLLLQ